MPDALYLGELEHLVLLAIMRCGEDAYTVPIRQMLADKSGRDVARGALYTSLDRLEAKGFVRSWLGDPMAVRGGRARRYFAVTDTGVEAVRAARAAMSTMAAGLETVLEPRR